MQALAIRAHCCSGRLWGLQRGALLDDPQLFRDPTQQKGNMRSSFWNDAYAKCLWPFPFLCVVYRFTTLQLFKCFSLLCCIRNQSNRENPETWLDGKGWEGKEAEGKYTSLSFYHLETPASQVKHTQKVMPFVSWPLPFTFFTCHISSLGQKAFVKCFCFYKGYCVLLAGHIQYLLACLTPGKSARFLCAWQR